MKHRISTLAATTALSLTHALGGAAARYRVLLFEPGWAPAWVREVTAFELLEGARAPYCSRNRDAVAR
jgi:hypothetical protein